MLRLAHRNTSSASLLHAPDLLLGRALIIRKKKKKVAWSGFNKYEHRAYHLCISIHRGTFKHIV